MNLMLLANLLYLQIKREGLFFQYQELTKEVEQLIQHIQDFMLKSLNYRLYFEMILPS